MSRADSLMRTDWRKAGGSSDDDPIFSDIPPGEVLRYSGFEDVEAIGDDISELGMDENIHYAGREDAGGESGFSSYFAEVVHEDPAAEPGAEQTRFRGPRGWQPAISTRLCSHDVEHDTLGVMSARDVKNDMYVPDIVSRRISGKHVFEIMSAEPPWTSEHARKDEARVRCE